MPQLAYSVSDLQQKVSQATAGDLVHANNVLNLAKKNVEDGQVLRFPVLPEEIRMELQHSHDPRPEKTLKKGESDWFWCNTRCFIYGTAKRWFSTSLCLDACSHSII